MSGPKFAFVTLLSSDSYLPGALVLASSLRDLHPSPPVAPEVDFKTVCIVTPETVDVKSIKALRKAFDLVIGVEVLEVENSTGLSLLGRPDLTTAITKLHVFRLTEFSKVIYLDADILPLQPMSHLFLTPHEFSACPDVGWPDIFNSGLMVLEPGEDKFQQLTELFKSKGSWDGADQGLLNEWRGPNWNRLSFTYNTTPTAAYTYAPAYKRFGSSIKAIHFIGQNKPWNSIPWRAPIDHPSAESMHSFGYSNLVDRWFAVYDSHYRPPVVATEEEYRIHHYQPAWETSTFDNLTPALGLDDLRKLAIEGVMTNSAIAPSGEGEYKSLPLEGRVDLMRPQRVVDENQPSSTEHRADHSSAWPYDSQSTQYHQPTDSEYRPQGREGLPSYLYRPPSPPREPSPFHHAPPEQSHDYGQSHDEHHHHHEEGNSWEQQQESQGHEDHHSDHRPPSPPIISWDPARDPPPNNPPPIVAMAFAEQQYSNVWDLPPSRPMHHANQEYRDPWMQQPSYGPLYQHRQEQQHGQHSHQQSHNFWNQPHQQQQQYPHQQQHRQHQQHQHGHQHDQQPSHHHQTHSHFSPPPWGGYQPAHSVSHQQSSHGSQPPSDPRFQPYPDAYHGQNPYEQHAGQRRHRPEDFFHAPAPSKIPTHLVREGHYTAVTTEEPRPDWKKVEAIFPWEQISRPRPRRVFPDWDPKPPHLQSPPRPTVAELEAGLLASEMAAEDQQPPPVPERQRSPSPPPHVRRKFNPPPTPPMRQGSTYVNAWDTDRSIQKYASVLQGRSSPFTPQPWPTHPGQEALASMSKKSPPEKEDEEEYTNWAERAEASSRDGDDEDDEVGSPLLSPKSAARRRAAKEKGNRYRHQGVQTDPIITESRGVQVSISSEAPKRPLEGNFTPPYRQANTRNVIPSKASVATEPKRVSIGTTSTISDPSFAPSSFLIEHSQHIKSDLGIGSPSTPVLRKRESSEDSVTTAADSSIISSPTKEVEETITTPRVQIRSPEISPVAGRGTGSSVVRRVGRVFSANTGMEIFKRGSEEVLARFLSQEPSGWEATRANAGPGTPSANY